MRRPYYVIIPLRRLTALSQYVRLRGWDELGLYVIWGVCEQCLNRVHATDTQTNKPLNCDGTESVCKALGVRRVGSVCDLGVFLKWSPFH